MSLLDEIPGYRHAVEQEKLIRDAAFLPVAESIGDFEVMPMTLRQLLLLRSVKSPVLMGGTVSPLDLARLLWFLSPQYSPITDLVSNRRFWNRCAKFFPPPLPRLRLPWLMRRWKRKAAASMEEFDRIFDLAKAYLNETFQDRPGVKGSMSSEPDYYSDGVGICAQMAREFGWSEDAVLDMPLKRLFQYQKEIKKSNGQKILFNPSDRLKNEWLVDLNRN